LGKIEDFRQLRTVAESPNSARPDSGRETAKTAEVYANHSATARVRRKLFMDNIHEQSRT